MTGKDVAATIIQQLGGHGKLKAMVSAKDFMYSDKDKSLTFKFSGSRKTNCIRITYNSMDLYDIEFLKINLKKLTCKTIEIIENVYNDQLIEIFERRTELYLKLF